MKVIVVKTDNSIEIKDLEGDVKEEMREIVGGILEAVRPIEAYRMNLMLPETCFCCDEDGRMKGGRVNLLASIFYNGKVSLLMEPIVGDIFLVGKNESGFRSLRDDEVNHYLNALAAMKKASLNFLRSVK